MCLLLEGVETRRRKGKKKREGENERRMKAISYSSNYRTIFINYIRKVCNFHLYVEICTNIKLSPYSLPDWLLIFEVQIEIN